MHGGPVMVAEGRQLNVIASKVGALARMPVMHGRKEGALCAGPVARRLRR
jgi:hypothetical protein